MELRALKLCLRKISAAFAEEGVDLDFYKQWKDWMAEFDMTPTNYNLYDEPCIFKNRWLSENERIAQLRKGLEIAAKLGFRTARLSVDCACRIRSIWKIP